MATRWTQTLEAAPQLDTSLLETAWAAAVARYEGVTLPVERFDARVARAVRALPGEARVSELCLDDLFLAAACEARDPVALRHFDRLLVELRAVADGIGVPADDALQLAREKLLVGEGRIADYGGRSTLAHWLKATVVNTALSLRRTQHQAASLDDPDLGILDLPDVAEWAEEALSREQARQVLEEGLGRAMGQLTRTSRSLLRQHYLDGVTLEALASYHGVHRATIARWIAEAKEVLLGHLEAELHGRLHSLLGQLRSRTSLGVRSLLESVR